VALKAKWTHLLLIVFLNAGSAVLEGSTMVALLLSLNILFDQTSSEIGSWPAEIVGWLGVGENKNTLFFFFIFSAIALQILKSCTEFLSRVVSTRLRTHVSLYVQSQVTSKLLSLEYQTLSRIPIGTQNSYFVIADQVAKTLTITLINPLINSTLFIVVYLIVLMVISVEVTLVAAACGLVLWLSLGTIYAWSKKAGAKISTGEKQLGGLVIDYLSAAKLLRIYPAANIFRQQMDTVRRRVLEAHQFARILEQMVAPAIDVLFVITVGVIFSVIFFSFDGEIVQTAPTAGIVLVVFNRLLPHFKQLNTMRSTYAGLSSRIEQIGELVSKTGLAPVEQTVQSQYSSAPQIEFKNLSFSYPDSDQQAISSLSCLFQPGAINVVKGQSGSGKSTIMNVLAKLYVQTGGEIIVNGKEFDQIDKCAWLSNLGYVDQECFLLNSTIKENILFGRKGYSHQQIEEACELAEVTEFLKRLRSNFNTVVGDRGLSLSGGQRQRIVLARALLNNPRVLLLDEPTSALDLTTEEKFLETLVQIASDCTVIMASHRESTDKCADRIIEI
tara:strand:+ start:1555 stop:3225 length:1671 start_codon:yes stop_codon:yes gene_type:complete